MRENKILSSAALITKIFIFFTIFLNVKAEVVNKKYFKNEQGILAIMYHRFEENKYPSTNIRLEIFKKHIDLIKENNLNFYNPGEFSINFEKVKKQKKIFLNCFYENYLNFLDFQNPKIKISAKEGHKIDKILFNFYFKIFREENRNKGNYKYLKNLN